MSHQFLSYFFFSFLPPPLPPFLIIECSKKNKLSAEPRYVQPQPLAFSDRTYNIRKLIELPHHHSLSGLTRRYEDTLFNFDFIHAKCAAGLIRGLVDDYEEAIAQLGGKDKVLATKLEEFATFIKQNVSFPSHFFLLSVS
jgi:hypothetical protein